MVPGCNTYLSIHHSEDAWPTCCHDPDASGHGTCTTTVCLLISTILVSSPCSPFVRYTAPVLLSMITHCLTHFDCVYLCLDLCSDLCLALVYKPCVHIVRSQTW